MVIHLVYELGQSRPEGGEVAPHLAVGEPHVVAGALLDAFGHGDLVALHLRPPPEATLTEVGQTKVEVEGRGH